MAAVNSTGAAFNTAHGFVRPPQRTIVEGFRKDLGPFVVAAETTRMAMVFTDAKEANRPLIFANDSFLSLTGYDREEVLGQSFDFLMARPIDPEALAQVEVAFAGKAESDFEINFGRKDGSMFWAAVFVSPVRDKTGDVVEHFASFLVSLIDCFVVQLSQVFMLRVFHVGTIC
jgi:PAS domain S-box-containing protein